MASPRLSEVTRLSVLAGAATWLLHPFATSRLYGAGDALWYANMLADFVTQLRAGVFPIFAGQSEFAFNGAVYPLRVAPMYQHLAGILDLLTCQSLGFFTIQHLTVVLCGVAGIFGCYLSLCRIAPDRRWSAVGFSVLYLSCPGLLATIYTQDLYMTWMAVPFAPLAAYGIMRTYRKDDITSQFWLAVPLAALWWAHSPIALWFALIAAASQIVRLATVNRGSLPVKRAMVGLLVFGFLAQYPFVSVAEVRTPGQDSTVIAALAHPEQMLDNIRSAFPAALLPLSEHARALGDLQLGYGLWVVLIFAGVVSFTRPGKDLIVLVASAAALLALLAPIPGLNRFLWIHMPAEIVRITYYWPMQRFYVILASLLAAAGQVAFGYLASRSERAREVFAWILVTCCAWSVWEARQFIRAATDRTASAEVSARSQRPENLFLTNDSYGLFGGLPPNFSNGVVDPSGQSRLTSAITGEALPLPARKVLQTGSLIGAVGANPGLLELSPTIHIEAKRRYALEFAFAREDIQGILQLSGRSLFREYNLPSSGEALAFGSGPTNTRRIELWTSDPVGDDVALKFIPPASGVKPVDFAQFGSYELREIVSEEQPVEMMTLVPFLARVRSEAPAILESPRMYMPGYSASVDGHPVGVRHSDSGLVAIQVPTGYHTVALRFTGPLILQFSYWCAIAAWLGTVLLIALGTMRALGAPRN